MSSLQKSTVFPEPRLELSLDVPAPISTVAGVVYGECPGSPSRAGGARTTETHTRPSTSQRSHAAPRRTIPLRGKVGGPVTGKIE